MFTHRKELQLKSSGPKLCITSGEQLTISQSQDGAWNVIHNTRDQIVAIFKDYFVGLVGFHSSDTIKAVTTAIGQHSGASINVKDTTLIFPGNEGHHGSNVTLYSHKSGGGLAGVASKCYLDLQSATLSFPTVFNRVGHEQKQNIVNGAMADFWKTIGFGHYVLLPIRAFQSQDTFTAKFFNEPLLAFDAMKFEPSFWGMINTTADQKLSNFYLKHLKLGVETLSNTSGKLPVPEHFVSAYQEGCNNLSQAADNLDPWYKAAPPPVLQPHTSSLLSSRFDSSSSSYSYSSSAGSTTSNWRTGIGATGVDPLSSSLSVPFVSQQSTAGRLSKLMATRQGYSSLHTDHTVQATFKTEENTVELALNVATWHLTNYTMDQESIDQYRQRKRQQFKEILKLLANGEQAGKPLDALLLQGGDFFHPTDRDQKSMLGTGVGVGTLLEEFQIALNKRGSYQLFKPKEFSSMRPVAMIINTQKWLATGKIEFASSPNEVVGLNLEERTPAAGQVAKNCAIIGVNFEEISKRMADRLIDEVKKQSIAAGKITVIGGATCNGKENEIIVIPSQQTYAQIVEPYQKYLLPVQDEDRFELVENNEARRRETEVGMTWEPPTKLLSLFDAQLNGAEPEAAQKLIAKMAHTFYYKMNREGVSFADYFLIENQTFLNLIAYQKNHTQTFEEIDAHHKEQAQQLKEQEAQEKEQLEQELQQREEKAQPQSAEVVQPTSEQTQQAEKEQQARIQAEQEREKMIAEDQAKREAERLKRAQKLKERKIDAVVVDEFSSVKQGPKKPDQHPDQFKLVRDAQTVDALYAALKQVLETDYPMIEGDQLIDLNKKALHAMEKIFHKESQMLGELKDQLITGLKICGPLFFLVVPLIILAALAIRYQYKKAHTQVFAYDMKIDGHIGIITKKNITLFEMFNTKPIANNEKTAGLQDTIRPLYATNSRNTMFGRMNSHLGDDFGTTDQSPRARVYYSKNADRKKELRILDENFGLKGQRVI